MRYTLSFGSIKALIIILLGIAKIYGSSQPQHVQQYIQTNQNAMQMYKLGIMLQPLK